MCRTGFLINISKLNTLIVTILIPIIRQGESCHGTVGWNNSYSIHALIILNIHKYYAKANAKARCKLLTM